MKRRQGITKYTIVFVSYNTPHSDRQIIRCLHTMLITVFRKVKNFIPILAVLFLVGVNLDLLALIGLYKRVL